MDLNWSTEEQTFRLQVRAWLHQNLPKQLPASSDPGLGMVELFENDDVEAFEAARDWQRTLLAGGYLAMSWPREHGGAGATLAQQVIFAEESARCGAPSPANVLGLALLGPTLIMHGTPEQRQRFLPKVLSAEEIWCQGYSEPGAGSDLAAVSTTAERHGDEFVINGQKIWTTFATFGHWIFMLARTDPDALKHKGLSYLLVDMHQPGVEVRPLRQMTGQAGFGEVFFTDARTPVTNLVGQINDGWRVATTTLAYERGANSLAQQVKLGRLVEDLIVLCQSITAGDVPLIASSQTRQAVARHLVDVEVMRSVALSSLSPRLHGEQPGPEASLEKVYWSELYQRITDTAMEVLATTDVDLTRVPPSVSADRWVLESLASRATTIYSGTSEIQRGIIAEKILGLPRGERG